MNGNLKSNKKYQIETPHGFVDFDGVGVVETPENILHFDLEDGSNIEVNYTHVFIVNNVEVIADDLSIGDTLETKSGFKKIVDIKQLDQKEQVYTILEVKNKDHSYYTNNIISKNCKFLGSSNTLIDSDILERLEHKEPISVKWSGALSIYEEPIPNKEYILGVDSSKGSSRDFSVVQVLKVISEKELKQVAMYRNNTISPHSFAPVVISISDYYNKALMMIENNDVGSSLCDSIFYEYEQDRIVNVDPKALGIRSNRKTKLEANLLLKEYMEKNQIEIVDQNTIYELSRYEEYTLDCYRCPDSDNDDCVTSLLWALYFITTDYYDKRSVDVKKVDRKYRLDGNDEEGPIAIFD